MSALRKEVMALPKEERLDYALKLLDKFCASDKETLVKWRQAFGLTPSEAKLSEILNNAYPRPLEKQTIYVAIYGHDAEVEEKIVDVFVSKARAKGVKIDLVWGFGYRMSEKVEFTE